MSELTSKLKAFGVEFIEKNGWVIIKNKDTGLYKLVDTENKDIQSDFIYTDNYYCGERYFLGVPIETNINIKTRRTDFYIHGIGKIKTKARAFKVLSISEDGKVFLAIKIWKNLRKSENAYLLINDAGKEKSIEFHGNRVCSLSDGTYKLADGTIINYDLEEV